MTDKQAEAAAKRWNVAFPVGTAVRYWQADIGVGEPFDSETRTEAWAVSGAAIVSLKGKSGGVSLNHLELR